MTGKGAEPMGGDPGELLAMMPYATALGIELHETTPSLTTGSLGWTPERCRRVRPGPDSFCMGNYRPVKLGRRPSIRERVPSARSSVADSIAMAAASSAKAVVMSLTRERR
ncbi:MAG: hypothetical protein JWM19_6592 [Actinomycetia bacterium]|nr:hypothetical protein [Actinomycetes bacterium]